MGNNHKYNSEFFGFSIPLCVFVIGFMAASEAASLG